MTSRLDRLFVLLESETSPFTRRAAARQLGEVQKLHPHELHNLLGRVLTYLRSNTWDTRIAAGQAIEAIVSNVPQWNPPGCVVKKESPSESHSLSRTGRLNFQRFDIGRVLLNSLHLLGSEGKEYDLDEEIQGGDQKERMARQRQLLNARLGLDGAAKLGLDTSELFTAEDLASTSSTVPNRIEVKSVSDVVQNEMMKQGGLSSREMNRARRKARMAMTKQRSRDTLDEEEPDRKRIKTEGAVAVAVKPEDFNNSSTPYPGVGENVPDSTGSWGDSVEWPFEAFADQLSQDLLSPRWQVRHGAATALRELLKVHGQGAGKAADVSVAEMEELHQLWLEDCALRLLCVLALDRFGDFVSDQVVAPVRETCAQTLGTVLNLMSPDGVRGVLRVLLQLLVQKDWEARHGGLLGLKYLLAVRKDMLTELLPIAYPPILNGLNDPTDDVGAVAASALIPVADTIVTLLGNQVESTVQKLWDLLLDQDELTAACNSFMGLLAALISFPQSDHLLRSYQLDDVLPRLWPFLSHSTSSVRKVTLETVRTLTAKPREDWNTELLKTALCHTFQIVLLESDSKIQLLAEQVWSNLLKNSPLDVLLLATCPMVSTWMCLAMQPTRTPFDSNLLIQFSRDRSSPGRRVKAFAPLESNVTPNKSEQKIYIGGGDSIPASARDQCVVRTRCVACRMLGLLSCYVVLPAPGIVYPPDDSPMDCYSKVLLVHLNSKSAVQRQVVGLLMAEWGRLSRLNIALGPPPDPLFDNGPGSSALSTQFQCPPSVSTALHRCLGENPYFDEIRDSYTRLLQDTNNFISRLDHFKVAVPDGLNKRVLTLDQIQQLADSITTQKLTACKLKPKVVSSIEESRQAIQRSATQNIVEQTMLNISTRGALAQAVISLNCLPEKLYLVFKPLLASICEEESEGLQMMSAKYLSELVEKCINRVPCPNDKVIEKLCSSLKCDPDFTPRIQTNGGEGTSTDSGVESMDSRNSTPTPANINNFNGILTLINQQKAAEGITWRKVNPITGRGPGRPPLHQPPPEEIPQPADNTQQKKNVITRRGAIFALKAIVSHLGADLKTKFPILWDLVVGHILEKVDASSPDSSSLPNETDAEKLIEYLQVLEVTADAVEKNLLSEVLVCLPKLSVLLKHPFMAVRHMAARCFASLAALEPGTVMNHFVAEVLHFLEATSHDAGRQGAIEALVCIIEKLQTNVIPYVVFLIVPVLGRMSDSNEQVRQCGTHAFGTLIQLMPLDGSVPDPPGMSQELILRKDKERFFISQLFNPKEMEDYKIPVPIKAQLRSYQQSGVNWLAFLNKYKLHGILCDDMGLGKTLQSICILAGDHYTRSLEYKRTGRADCAPLRSLVICPPTLTGHWVYEVRKFLPREYLKPLQYAGMPADRERLRNSIYSYNLIVASYDIVRKDISFFASHRWNYVILDEGQYIKNGKTKASKAIKTIVANHRLILSGTPIQNNVLELWSLFDFLMPGYLGTEKQFNARYSRPILASREAKSSQKEQEAGVLAMESLHRQVLPFLLRRMKEDVLQDLPPKITQDYYCDLSPLQEALYEDFARSPAHETLTESLKGSTAAANAMQGNSHVFQALRYLQKVCNHPKLVLTPSHPEYNKVTAQLLADGTSMVDIRHAAKLPALKQLLLDCGIGCGAAADLQGGDTCINQHRALIFCQLKTMLDIIEHDLLKNNMHGVTYLRLDGSVPATQRHAIVTRFNKDPSIDVLLLTTQVGGLGLNLTGADTVIFVEHDWNPMRDLQAMDRAHRIGQKKVVNVYRLITRGTLEEKIMGLQKFKLLTANTVISSENATMETMGTDQLLDLFSLDGKGNVNNSESSNSSRPITMKSVLSALPDLWDEKQYEEEYDLSAFVANLRK